MEQVKAVIRRLPAGERLGKRLIKVLKSWREAPRRWRVGRKARALRRDRRNPAAKARVLVTGDIGRLGSIVAAVLKADYEVVGFDMKAGRSEQLRNYGLLKKRMDGCQFVVHTAAIPHPALGTIESFFETNVIGSFNVMRAAAANKVKRVIYFSSIGYYGTAVDVRLKPAYFPIDEGFPIASMEGRAEGMLDAYSQSKVMAEQLLAWYGTHKIFEAIALRLSPVATKAVRFPPDGSWKAKRSPQSSFWTNLNPNSISEVVKRALEAPGEFWYEAFNICDKYAPECIDVKTFLAEEYPDVPVKGDLTDNQSLITPAKAERMLGFKPCEDVR